MKFSKTTLPPSLFNTAIVLSSFAFLATCASPSDNHDGRSDASADADAGATPAPLACAPSELQDGPNIEWKIRTEDYAHTDATRQLPFWNEDLGADGLYQIAANDLVFRVRTWGFDNTGPALVLLHGFPSSSIMWEHLGQEAASEGYRVVAIDQRGTSPDARPLALEAYTVPSFLDDLEAITTNLGLSSYHLAGHDIGCVVSWMAASQMPEQVESLSCLSVSHPATLKTTFVDNPPQYIQVFTMPSPAPEDILSANNAEQLRGQYAFMNEDECREYNSIFMEPDALRATIDFYRAIALSYEELTDVLSDPISAPTLFLYGTGEQWVREDTLAGQEVLVNSARYEIVELANAGPTGHFVVESNRDRVSEEILEHIAKSKD